MKKSSRKMVKKIQREKKTKPKKKKAVKKSRKTDPLTQIPAHVDFSV